jgi:hypothetical protein
LEFTGDNFGNPAFRETDKTEKIFLLLVQLPMATSVWERDGKSFTYCVWNIHYDPYHNKVDCKILSTDILYYKILEYFRGREREMEKERRREEEKGGNRDYVVQKAHPLILIIEFKE